MASRWLPFRRKAENVLPTAKSASPHKPSDTDDSLASLIKSIDPGAANLRQEQTIKRLLAAYPTSDLPNLDSDMRWRSGWWDSPWEEMQPKNAALLIEQAHDPISTAAGLSMHRNGHIREVGVTKLATFDDQRSVRWLVLRCADWVEEVRTIARGGLAPFLSIEHTRTLIDAMPLLEGARFERGWPAGDLQHQIEAVLSLPEADHDLRAAIHSSEKRTRRAVVRLLAPKGADLDLLRHVMQTNDAVAITAVASTFPNSGHANSEAGDVLFLSPMARFRSEGLWRLLQAEAATNRQALVEVGLLDAAPSVRDVAQRWIATHRANEDVATFYRVRLASDPLAALRGLGDRPDQNDAEAARRHLGHELPAVRLVALRLLARLGQATDIALFGDRFINGTAKERREALVGLKRSGGSASVAELWAEALASDDLDSMKRVLFQILPLADRWLRLSIGLQAAASTNHDLKATAYEALQRTVASWNNGYISRPTVAPAILRSQLEAARPIVVPVRWGRPNLETTLDFMIPKG